MWELNCAQMCMGINLCVLYASHKKGKTCHLGSPDHSAWLPKVVGRLIALLVILPLARKKTNRKSQGGSSASAPGSTRMGLASTQPGGLIQAITTEKGKQTRKRRALCLHHHNVSFVPRGSCGQPNLPHIPPANGSSSMPPSTGGGNVASPTCHTYHPPCPDHGGGTKTPPHSNLGCLDKWGSTSTANSWDMQ